MHRRVSPAITITLQPLVITGFSQPVFGTVAVNPWNPASLVYTPQAILPTMDVFTYTVTDGITQVPTNVSIQLYPAVSPGPSPKSPTVYLPVIIH